MTGFSDGLQVVLSLKSCLFGEKLDKQFVRRGVVCKGMTLSLSVSIEVYREKIISMSG